VHTAIFFLVRSESQGPLQPFYREILIWHRLRHPNIVPLIGIDTQILPSSWCMVSPWMKNGTVINYLKKIEGLSRQSAVNVLVRALLLPLILYA
jgi:serine/threonine protein kinase